MIITYFVKKEIIITIKNDDRGTNEIRELKLLLKK